MATFTEQNTPYAIDNMLMLVVDGKDRRLINSFYISNFLNIREDQSVEEQSKLDCNNAKTRQKIYVLKYASPDRFFINYQLSPAMTETDRVSTSRQANASNRSSQKAKTPIREKRSK